MLQKLKIKETKMGVALILGEKDSEFHDNTLFRGFDTKIFRISLHTT